MWRKLRKQVAVERQQLNKLVDTHRPLLEKCSTTRPDDIELSALAAMLHSFYTGIENMFKRIAVEIDGKLPSSPFWHRDLLEAMIHPAPNRQAVISDALRNRLREYLEFRHVFRQAYSFQLRWDKMETLVLECEQMLRWLEKELDAFLKSALQEE